MGGVCTRNSFDSVERISSMQSASGRFTQSFGVTDKIINELEAKRKSRTMSLGDNAQDEYQPLPRSTHHQRIPDNADRPVPLRVVQRQRSTSAPARILPTVTIQPIDSPGPAVKSDDDLFAPPPPSRQSHPLLSSTPSVSLHQGVHLGDLWVIAASRQRSPASTRRSTMSSPDDSFNLPGALNDAPPRSPGADAQRSPVAGRKGPPSPQPWLNRVPSPNGTSPPGSRGRPGRCALDPLLDVARPIALAPALDGTFMSRSPQQGPLATIRPRGAVLPAIAAEPPIARVVQAGSKLQQLEDAIFNAPAHVRATMSHAARIIQKNYRNFRLARMLNASIIERRLATLEGKQVRPKQWKFIEDDEVDSWSARPRVSALSPAS